MKSKFSVLAALAAAGLTYGAGPALAYIGPGAGLSLLGALWGIVAAVLAALLFLLIWPLRRLLRRQRPAVERSGEAKRSSAQQQSSAPVQRP